MAKLIECPLCDARIKVGADYLKASLTCPSCGEQIAVPGAVAAKTARREELEEDVLEFDDELIVDDAPPTPRRAPVRPELVARREPASTPHQQPAASRDIDHGVDEDVGPRSAAILFAVLGGGFVLTVGALIVLGIYFWNRGAEADQPTGQQLAQQQVAQPAMPQPSSEQTAGIVATDDPNSNPVAASPSVTPEATAPAALSPSNQQPSNPQPAATPPAVAQTPVTPPATTPATKPTTLAATTPPVTAEPAQPAVPPVVPPVVPPAVPPVVAKPDVPGVAPVGGLRYVWAPGRQYPYRVTIEAQIGDTTERTLGLCTYQVTTAPAVVRIQKPEESSGTAFVISSDGVLATCAHVVKDAKQIEVTLGNQKYSAQVIGLSPNRDIALIRITAKDLPTLPLSDSETVQLAQPIRVIGYPLSDVLGRNVKVTSGTVSGLNQDLTGKTFQIDASINPGNSGGPVVNEFGEVVGIASSKLTGQVISTVGFAVPINDAKTLLQQHQLKFTAPVDPREKLDGPMLAERVTRATAFVHVVIGASQNRTPLKFNSNFTTFKQRTARGFGGIPDFPRTGLDNGKLMIDEFGQVTNFEGGDQLPYMLGPLAMLPLEPLSASALGTWSETKETTITRIQSEGRTIPGFPSSLRRRISPFGSPFANDDNEKRTVYQATETTTFTLGDTVNDLTGVKKKYELRSHDHPTTPFVHLTGEGLWQFNHKDGVPHAVEFKMQLNQTVDSITLRIPLTVKFEYVDPKVLIEERRVADEKAKEVAAKAAETQKLAEDKAWQDLDKLEQPKLAKLVQRYRLPSGPTVAQLQVGPQGQVLIGTSDGFVRFFDATKTDQLAEWKKPSSGSLHVTADGRFAAAHNSKEIAVFDLETRAEVATLKSKFFPFERVAFAPDGSRVYGVTFQKEVEIFELPSGRKHSEFKVTFGQIKGMTVSEDGKQLSLIDDKQMETITLAAPDDRKLTPFAAPKSHAWSMHFANSGRIVRTLQQGADFVDLANPERAEPLDAPCKPGSQSALAPDGRRFAVLVGKEVVVSDISENRPLDRWEVDPQAAQKVAVSADGKYLVTSGQLRIVQLWELEPGK